ncbi:MAG: AAA family ATPase [Ignavibacteria bacterium]|nr:AAA family ATPase [Ignavibacteria bacterium]
MFNRQILRVLSNWAEKKGRKPLILRGARQVGKTTVVNQFSMQFDEYLYLNLELKEDKQPFINFDNVDKLVEAIFFLKNKSYSKNSKTLIFIDEIQFVPEAVNILRYFYELYPDLYVIAAGSMLESVFNNEITFPVGRVEYLVLRPASFPEFLDAMNEQSALTQLGKIPLEDFAYSKLLSLFHTYALIGGMPEIINNYAKNKDLAGLKGIYESLLASYIDDVEKYGKNPNQTQILRHTIRSSFAEAGKRIKYHGFGNSNYGSREMGEALRTLEKALLINIVFPQTSTVLPLLPDKKKSPRLQLLDTGLINYFLGIRKEIFNSKDLNSVHKGTVIEHLVGQELLAPQYDALSALNFWVREKNTSLAEIDYLYQYDTKLIPIEVKSGSEGRLKSLHIFMDLVPHNIAVRFYAGKLDITKTKTPNGKEYFILNMPYFLVSQINFYLNWFENEIIRL